MQVPPATANGEVSFQNLSSVHPQRQWVRPLHGLADLLSPHTPPSLPSHTPHRIVNMTRVFPMWDPSKHHIWYVATWWGGGGGGGGGRSSVPLSPWSSRHVVKGTRDCFYSKETWDGCEPTAFAANAQMCALHSLRNLHITSEDSGGPMGSGLIDLSCCLPSPSPSPSPPHSAAPSLTLPLPLSLSDDGNLIRFPEVDDQLYRHAKQLLLQGVSP